MCDNSDSCRHVKCIEQICECREGMQLRFLAAIRECDIVIIKYFLTNGLDPNEPYKKKFGLNGFFSGRLKGEPDEVFPLSSLMSVYRKNKKDAPKILKLLLNHGANPNLADSNGKTTWHFAATEAYNDERKDYEMLKCMISHMEEKNLEIICSADNAGTYACEFIIERDLFVKMLPQDVIEPAKINKILERAVLDLAKPTMIEYLLQNGADPNYVDEYVKIPVKSISDRNLLYHSQERFGKDIKKIYETHIQLFDDAKNLHAKYIEDIAPLIPICEDPENQDFDEILQKIIVSFL